MTTSTRVERLTKWVEALRSGDYKQGREFLKRRGESSDPPGDWEYCCLGVLCEINPDITHYKQGSFYFEDEWGETLFLDELIPYSVAAHEFGLSISAQDRLSTLNDVGTPFSDIADLIEEMVIPQVAETGLCEW